MRAAVQQKGRASAATALGLPAAGHGNREAHALHHRQRCGTTQRCVLVSRWGHGPRPTCRLPGDGAADAQRYELLLRVSVQQQRVLLAGSQQACSAVAAGAAG